MPISDTAALCIQQQLTGRTYFRPPQREPGYTSKSTQAIVKIMDTHRTASVGFHALGVDCKVLFCASARVSMAEQYGKLQSIGTYQGQRRWKSLPTHRKCCEIKCSKLKMLLADWIMQKDGVGGGKMRRDRGRFPHLGIWASAILLEYQTDIGSVIQQSKKLCSRDRSRISLC